MSEPDPNPSALRNLASWLISDYGMLLVLILLAGLFTAATWKTQQPTGAAAARQFADTLAAELADKSGLVIVVRDTPSDTLFAEVLSKQLAAAGFTGVATLKGEPATVRQQLVKLLEDGAEIRAIACNQATYGWRVYERVAQEFPKLRDASVYQPAPVRGSSFLTRDNLLNIANQIAVIAIIAIGMTMVVITGGIDLSVGSLLALSAVTTTLLIRDYAGGTAASALGMTGASLGGIAVCAALGAFSGLMVTQFRVPPFIVTLAMMLMASGAAYLISEGQSIDQVPDSFIWLGRGADLFNIPNAVLLMLGLYGIAHVVMTRMKFGRYVYAVGGNAEAARLSGVHVNHILMVVYILCGALAGLGGVIMASQLKSGAPTYGQMYELYVIAAVVVGGTSLSGGEGKIFGTLVGALIIAVIQNGMNLTGIESYTQKVVLGLVILIAVLLDRLRRVPT